MVEERHTDSHINPLEEDRNPHRNTDDLANRPDFAIVKGLFPYRVDIPEDENIAKKQPGIDTEDEKGLQKSPRPARNSSETMFGCLQPSR